MKVLIPGALHSYTGASQVQADGATLDALFDDLDRRYPGLRFRVVDEQGGVHLRPGCVGGHAGLAQRDPAGLAEMRHHRRNQLHKLLDALA